jgi:uncharacterized membrane protein YgcG
MTKAEREKRHQREVIVSRAKLILIVVCLIAIPITFWVNHSDVGSVKNRVAKVESPCLKATEEPTPKNKKLCRESFEKAVLTITHPQACAIERKAGTLKAIRELAAELNVSFSEPCAGARLAQEKRRGDERAATTARRDAASRAPTADAPAGSGGSPTTVDPGSGGGVGPGNSGDEGGGGPGSGDGGNPDESSGSGGSSQGSPETSAPESPTGSSAGVLPETLEAVGGAASEAVGKTGEAAKGMVEGLGKGLGDTVGGG